MDHGYIYLENYHISRAWFPFHSDIGSDMESSMVGWFVEKTCEYYLPILSSYQLMMPTVVSVPTHPVYL